jgi:hypothetical protein
MMNRYPKRILPVVAMLAAGVLAGCGAKAGATPISTDAILAIYTTAAQTMQAQYTATAEQSSLDQNASSLATDTAVSEVSATNLPELTFLTPTPIPNTLVNAAGSNACDNSIYISDVTIPDNTVVDAGQGFTKTWMFQNTGSCTWDANYTLTFISGDQMSGVNTSIDTSVTPGAQAAISVDLTAPTGTGNYTGYWQLTNDSGTPFGAEVYVLIDVSQDATSTPTVTPTTSTAATATPIPPTAMATTSVPPTAIATTAVPPTAVPTTAIPPTPIPTTAVPPTAVPPTAVPPTANPTATK